MSDPVETVLSSTFLGLNRVVSETELNEAQSPDTTDARNTDRKAGQCGPRLGRQRFATHTYPLLGMGMLVTGFGRFKLIGDTNGDWTAAAVAWAGVTPATPQIAVTNLVLTSNVATLTSARHSLTVGTVITVALTGGPALYADVNGSRTITAVATNTFSWAQTHADIVTGAATGTVTSGVVSGKNTSAGVRFLQFGKRVIAYNGVDRPMTFNGNRWENLGILGGTDYSAQFTPTVTLTGGATIIPAFGASSTTTKTITTSVAHGLAVGQRVTINVSHSIYNGTFTVVSVGSTTTFTFTTTGSDTQSTESITGTITVLSSSVLVTNMVVSGGNLGTITTTSAHGFLTGDSILFTDINGTLNGGPKALIYGYPGVGTFTATPVAFTATYISPTSFSIVMVGATNYAGDVSLITAQGCYAHKTTAAVAGITGTYYYYIVAANSTKRDVNGRIVESLPSIRSAAATPVAQSVTLGAIPSTHPDYQVDEWHIYRTENGGFDSGTVPEFQDFFYLDKVPIGTTTYTDTKDDSSGWSQNGDTSNRLRFTTYIPPTFRIAAVYGDRVFAAGFDPISSSTVTTTEGNATVTLATGTWPSGIKGCFFQQANDDGIYTVKAAAAMTITLDRVFKASTGSIAGGTKGYTLFRNPNEIWFSDYQTSDGWGKDGEFNRLKHEIAIDKEITGLFPFQNSLIVFTQTEIWAVYGKGPNRFDVKKLTDAACVDAGAVSQDSIFRSGNECHFLSLDGPASIDSVGTAINVKFYGTPLNVDWLDTLTAAESKLACAGTDGRAIWYSVPSATGQTRNSKTFRFERDTGGWWEETGMSPLRFIRQDGTDGQIQQLFYLQTRFVIKPQTGTFDLLSAALTDIVFVPSNDSYATIDVSRTVTNSVQVANVCTLTSAAHNFSAGQSVVVNISDSDYNGTFTITAVTTNTFSYSKAGDTGPQAVTGTAYVPLPTSNGGLEQCFISFYIAGVFNAHRLIVSNTAHSITWSGSAADPYYGNVDIDPATANTYEIGNIGWKWLTKATLIPGHRKTSEAVYVTFTKSASATILTNDVIDDDEATNQVTISCANKVESKVGVNGSNQIYQMRLASRTGAIIQDVTLRSTVESDII